MKITRIKVDNLFGTFEHCIDFNQEQITIIHGPNGIGKTILLRMIYSFFKLDFKIFFNIPFSIFEVTIDNSIVLKLENKFEKRKSETIQKLVISNSNGDDPCIISPVSGKHVPVMVNIIEQTVPEIIRIGQDQWLNRHTNQIFSAMELINNYEGIVLQNLPNKDRKKIQPWLHEIIKKMPIYFIETDRLIKNVKGSPSPDPKGRSSAAVTVYSRELTRLIRDTLATSAQISSKMDSTFPTRLINAELQKDDQFITEDQIRNELKSIEDIRQRLIKAGFLDKEESALYIPSKSLDSFKLNVLSIYLLDVKEKFKVYDNLLKKIELFQRILNNRILFKTFNIDKSRGFIFQNESGDLRPDSLSSGEQHEIVLLYELIFKIRPSSLILIDEPEISLHIAWQHEFLSDLVDVAKSSGFEALIASHSPDIINERWDLTVELKGKGGK